MFLRINVNNLNIHSNAVNDESERHIDYDVKDDDDGPSEDEFKDELDSNNDSLYGSEEEDPNQNSAFKRIITAIKEFKKFFFNIYSPKNKNKLDEDLKEAGYFKITIIYYNNSFEFYIIKQSQCTY